MMLNQRCPTAFYLHANSHPVIPFAALSLSANAQTLTVSQEVSTSKHLAHFGLPPWFLLSQAIYWLVLTNRYEGMLFLPKFK